MTASKHQKYKTPSWRSGYRNNLLSINFSAYHGALSATFIFLGSLGFFLFEETFNEVLFMPPRPLPVLEGTDGMVLGPILSFSVKHDTAALNGDPKDSELEFGNDIRILLRNGKLINKQTTFPLIVECDAEMPVARLLPYLRVAASLGLTDIYQAVRLPNSSWPYTDKFERSFIFIDLKISFDHLIALERVIHPQTGLTCNALAQEAAAARRAGMQVFLELND